MTNTRRSSQPSPAWTGYLQRTSAGIHGEMSDPHGWTLRLSAHVQAFGLPAVPVEPPRMWLRTDPGAQGVHADPLRVELAAGAIMSGALERITPAEWTGSISWRSHFITLTGTVAAPGRIELRGEG